MGGGRSQLPAWECRRDWGAGGAEPESGSATAPSPRLAASRVIWGEGDGLACPSAPCGAVVIRAEDPRPRSDATARGTGSSPGASRRQQLQGLRRGMLRLGRTPPVEGDPESGIPHGRGREHGPSGRRGSRLRGSGPTVGSCSGPDLPLALGTGTAGAAPAEPGDSPPADGRMLRSPRRCPRGPLPPEPQPGLQPLKVWRHGTATGGCAGLAGLPGSAGRRGGATPERSGAERGAPLGAGGGGGGRAGCGGGCGRSYLLRRRLPALGGAPSPEAR